MSSAQNSDWKSSIISAHSTGLRVFAQNSSASALHRCRAAPAMSGQVPAHKNVPCFAWRKPVGKDLSFRLPHTQLSSALLVCTAHVSTSPDPQERALFCMAKPCGKGFILSFTAHAAQQRGACLHRPCQDESRPTRTCLVLHGESLWERIYPFVYRARSSAVRCLFAPPMSGQVPTHKNEY